MGDIADMMLDGTLDAETGEYIGAYCKQNYGTESPGFHVSVERGRRERQEQQARNIVTNASQNKTPCPECGKRVKEAGLTMHMHDVHGYLY